MRFFYLICLLWLSSPAFSQNNNYFTVKFPDDKTYIGCNASAPIEAPVITQYSCSLSVGVSRYDEIYNSNESGSCYKIFRRWRLSYWCDYDPNNLQPTIIENPTNSDTGPTAIGNPANHGFLQYTQVIKVRDDVPPVFTTCPASPVVFCDYTNNNTALYGNTCEGPVELTTEVSDVCSGTDVNITYRLFLDLDANGSMETYIYTGGPNAWPVERTIDNGKVKGKIVFPANYQLPYGLHKVEWVANDNCGNESVCKYEFLVKDCKNPTIVCINGLSVNIMQTGMITLPLANFIQYTSDNCTPNNLIQTGIRKAGTGTGFPNNSGSVNFDCTEVGTQLVEVWAQDATGNADYCLTYVIVQDNSNTCTPTASLSGTVMKQNGQVMEGVQIAVLKSNQTQAAAANSNPNGSFGPMPLWPGCYSLTAAYNDTEAHHTGISTWDALLASLHAEAVSPFDQPWQFAAADVNGDGWITPEDGWAITQMAIGGTPNWPVVPNWQFIGANSVVPQDQSLLTAAQTYCIAAGNTSPFHWVGVKTGDLDNSYYTGSKDAAETSKRTATFSAPDQAFEAGTTVALTIQAPEVQGLAGFQFTLDYDPTALSVTEIQHIGGLEQVQTAHFDATHQITAGWQNAIAFYPDGAAMFGGKTTMTIVFNTLKAGKLSDFVGMNNNRISSEVYTSNMMRHNAALSFVPVSSNKSGVSLLPVMPDPNPGTEVVIRYELTENSNHTRIIVLDDHSSIISEQQVSGTAGYHEVSIPINARRSGAYTVQLITDAGIKTERIIVSKG